MKILFFDNFSLWACARRMEQGRLHWPSSEQGRVQLTREEFALLIGGIDLGAATKRKWYRRAAAGNHRSQRKVREYRRFGNLSTAEFVNIETDDSCFPFVAFGRP